MEVPVLEVEQIPPTSASGIAWETAGRHNATDARVIPAFNP